MNLPSNRVLLVICFVLLCSNFTANSKSPFDICGSENNQIAVYDTNIPGFTCRNPAWVFNMLTPANTLIPVDSGSCPTNFTEITAMNALMLLGTVASNSDVGDTGGNSSITPTGTVSQPTFTGNQQNFTTVNNVSLLGLGQVALTSPTSITPAGTVSQPSFTGNAFNPTPPYKKVIWCRKT